MSVGVGILLIVVGAILAFAVRADLHWLSLPVAGWILILAGVVELVITLGVWNRRRHAGKTTRREVYRDGEPPVIVEEREQDDIGTPQQTGPGNSVRAPAPYSRRDLNPPP